MQVYPFFRVNGFRHGKLQEIATENCIDPVPSGREAPRLQFFGFYPSADRIRMLMEKLGSFFDRDVRVFRVIGTEVTDTAIRIALPGRPGSMRARAR